MRPIIADTHTHTLSCGHAFSTLAENAKAAAAAGLKILAHTEHAPALIGSPTYIYFNTLRVLPRYMDGVMILRGTEVNIMDYGGSLDLSEERLANLEWVVASYHPPLLEPCTVEEGTRGWMAVAQNPHVDVIGHCGAARYPFEHKPVIREFAETGKIVEINNNSFIARAGSKENCRAIAELCAEYRMPVVLSSDAHYAGDIGKVETAAAMLEEIGFPEELILNIDYDRFLEVARRTSGKTLTDEV
ncbi:MAG: phosphatase [Oscillospiraceae bacterium]|nr:phosphatase [Oscillospiraceae bacterium]